MVELNESILLYDGLLVKFDGMIFLLTGLSSHKTSFSSEAVTWRCSVKKVFLKIS